MILVTRAMQSQRDECWSAADSKPKATNGPAYEQDLKSSITRKDIKISAFRPSIGEPRDLQELYHKDSWRPVQCVQLA